MKLMIASDIHGSAYYCEKMVEAYKKEQADRLLLLGDILYHGPRNDLPRDYDPKKVISMLNPMKNDILCVRGNCDGEVDQMVLDFPIMAEYSLIFDGEITIFATHGHHYNLQNLPPHKEGDVLLHGHTHVPACICENGMWYINPGSVSIPKENSPHSYMIYEDGGFVWKDIEGVDYKKVSLSTKFD